MNDYKYTINAIIIQSNSFCNLDCKYCYLSSENRAKYKPIDKSYIQCLLDRVIENGNFTNNIDIFWHAGEPMAVPIGDFNEYLDVIDSHPLSQYVGFRNIIQTNGTHLNQEWIELLLRRNVVLTLSLDGPKKHNDSNRIFRSGKGSFEKVMKGISLLREYEKNFGILAVVTDETVDHPDQIYNFLVDTGATHIMFNPVRSVGQIQDASSQSFEEKYTVFFQRVFELAKKDNTVHLFREFNQKVSKCGSPPIPQEALPLRYLLLTNDGYLSTFAPDLAGVKSSKYEDFIYGHVTDTSISSILEKTSLTRAFKDIFSGIRKCKDSCDYFQFCGGRRITAKFFQNGSLDSTETEDCRNTIQTPMKVLGYVDSISKQQ